MDINSNQEKYKKTKAGWLPDDWEFGIIQDIGKLKSGQHLSVGEYSEEFQKDLVPYFTGPSDITKNQNTVTKWTSASSKSAEIGEILVTVKGSGAGRIDLMSLDIAVLGRQLMALNLVKGINGYGYYWLTHNENRLSSFAVGNMIPGLSRDDILSFPIPLPPLPEQKRIAEILSTWDAAIQKLDALIAKKQELKKGLMQKLLTGQLRFPEFVPAGGTKYKQTKLGMVPEDWEVVEMGEIGSTYSGLSGKTKEDFGAGKPYIPYMNIFANSAVDINRLDFVSIKSGEHQNRVEYGDVFFTVSSETPDEVGMSSVVLDEIGECYLNSFCFGFRPYNLETTIPSYLRYIFRSAGIRRAISIIGQGATRYNLSKKNMLKLLLPIPPILEQHSIGAFLSEIDAEIANFTLMSAQVSIQKKGLMQQLLTGAVRTTVKN